MRIIINLVPTCTEKNSLSYEMQNSQKINFFDPILGFLEKNGFSQKFDQKRNKKCQYMYFMIEKKNLY
jgi:hypothetical protein